MPPGMRFAQAALAARAPVAQDETWGHAARPGSQPDAAAPAASALVPCGHARSLQVIPWHQLAPPARSRAPTPSAWRCFPGSPSSNSCDRPLARRLLAKRLLEGGVGLGVAERRHLVRCHSMKWKGTCPGWEGSRQRLCGRGSYGAEPAVEVSRQALGFSHCAPGFLVLRFFSSLTLRLGTHPGSRGEQRCPGYV